MRNRTLKIFFYTTVCLLYLQILCFNLLVAQGQNIFNIKKLPEIESKQLINTNSIIREHNIDIIVSKIGKCIIHNSITITILNENGKDDAILKILTDKFGKTKNINGKLYDANGDFVKNLQPDDYQTVAMSSSSTFVDDNKFVIIELVGAKYPYTININYDKVYNGYFSYLNLYFSKFNQSCQNTKITLQEPIDLVSKFRVKNCGEYKYSDTIIKNKRYKVWGFENFKAKINEPYNENINDVLPYFELTPNKFVLDNEKGDFSSWNLFGSWIFELYKNTDNSNEKLTATCKNLTANCKNDVEKVSTLYKYLQNNYRYVSIQLGIGGLKPIDAVTTADNKFGDCKALSNMMKVLLQSVNIPSNLVLIYGDHNNRKFDSSYVCNQFNHVIIFVPLAKDTIWLECTSSTQTFNTLGAFTENRTGLLINEKGGFLINTPKSKFENNWLRTTSTIIIDDKEYEKSYTKILTSGEMNDEIDLLNICKGTEKVAYLFNYIYNWHDRNNDAIINVENINSATIETKKEKSDFIKNNRICLPATFFQPYNNLFNKFSKERDINQAIKYNHRFSTMDTTNYIIPTSYLKAVNQDYNYKYQNEFFIYSRTVNADNLKGIVQSVCSFQLLKDYIKPSEYQIFFNAIKQFNKQTNQDLIFTNQ